jgi:bifunctional DNA-binding transcriptional regulator/antitoxin component of YhaV-PrlF toxin-antitoxin module
MADITKVSERGQTAIPARLRREHDVPAGTELVWEALSEDEWRVLIRRKPPARPDPLGMRGFARRFRATRTTADWMAELREGEDAR